MIEWVYRAASKALPNVVVATDDKRVMDAVKKFGGKAMMTPRSCRSGTERMAAVARKTRADYYVNVQGDEPMMNPSTIRVAVQLAVKTKSIATPITDLEKSDWNNPNAVKVALGQKGRALYFSRSLIPFPRDGKPKLKLFKHLGLYVYPRKNLFQFVSLPQTQIEITEMLEQLRALYYGFPIYTAYTKFDSIGVDTPTDLKNVSRRLKNLKMERA